MSAERIKEAALWRFAAQGYEATSLAEIAGDVGIKTPSFYAHFRSKQKLFIELVELAFTRELEVLQTSLQQPKPVVQTMKDYLYGTLERFDSASELRFWLRSIYLPPRELMEEIRKFDRLFAGSLERLISSALCDSRYGALHASLPHDILTSAFMGILRSVHAELLYCGSLDSAKILTAMWAIFERSLSGKDARIHA